MLGLLDAQRTPFAIFQTNETANPPVIKATMPRMTTSRILACCLAFFFLPLPAFSDTAKIAAAAHLSQVLPKLAREFEQQSGHTLQISYASSGTLARQIIQGAPFELLISADRTYPNKLVSEGLTNGKGKDYALGRLAILVPKGSPVDPQADLSGLTSAAHAGTLSRIAIANPEFAPYGVAARSALQSTGLWEMVENKLVTGENAAQTAQFARSGQVEAALIPYSLALALKEQGDFVAVDEALYPPIFQRMVLLKNAGQAAQAFYAFMLSPMAQETLVRFGFGVPGSN